MITKDVPKDKPLNKPAEYIAQKPAKKKPAIKRKKQNKSQATGALQQKHNPKDSLTRTTGLLSKAKVPAINIYYSHSNIYEYMQALAIRGCIFLFKSPSGSFFGHYDPSTGNITTNIPRDLKDFSPRSRVLAIYGENPLTDNLIEKAIDLSPEMFIPDECKLIALLN